MQIERLTLDWLFSRPQAKAVTQTSLPERARQFEVLPPNSFITSEQELISEISMGRFPQVEFI